MNKGNQRKVVENWKKEVPELNCIHKTSEVRNVKHDVHKAKLRQIFSFDEGVTKRKKTPIKGIKEVNIKGLRNFIFMKDTIIFHKIYESRLIRTINFTLIKLQSIQTKT